MRQDLLLPVVDQLLRVGGVAAVVLGGSRARGTHRRSSDWDVGVLYGGSYGDLDLEALNAAARDVDDAHRLGLATAPGAWGSWGDGGAWSVVDGERVDLIYRNLARVERVVQECQHGRYVVGHQLGHPAGFRSYFYAAEVALCRPLADADGVVAALAERLVPYPAALRSAVVDRAGYDAGFLLDVADAAAGDGDAAWLAAVLGLAALSLAEVIYALAGVWYTNEKDAIPTATALPTAPSDFAARVALAFAALPGDTGRAVGCLRELATDVRRGGGA